MSSQINEIRSDQLRDLVNIDQLFTLSLISDEKITIHDSAERIIVALKYAIQAGVTSRSFEKSHLRERCTQVLKNIEVEKNALSGDIESNVIKTHLRDLRELKSSIENYMADLMND